MPTYNQAVGAREAAFEPLSRLVTRVINAFAISGASQQSINNDKTVARKLQGRRAKSVASSNTVPNETNTEETPKLISVSQMSFDGRVENLDKFIQILQAEPLYKPNEVELQVGTLKTLLADLRAKNTAVLNAVIPLSNARIVRNETLYEMPNNLKQAADDIKNYIKSVFGPTSSQYKQISSIKFTKPRS
jgi:hypothetical protein